MVGASKPPTFNPSASDLNILAKRLAERRRRLMYQGQIAYSSAARNEETEESEALLNLLHQELKDINASMVRTNTALLELVEEMKFLRKSQQEDSTN